MLKKLLKYLLIFLLLLVIIVLGGSYYLLNTTAGLKQSIALANQYSGYQIRADSISGKWLHKTELKNLSITGNHLKMNSETLILDWDSAALLDKSLIVKTIVIDNATVQLPPPAESQNTSSQPLSLNDINLPLGIQLQDLLVTNLTIKNPVTEGSSADSAGDMVIEKVQLGVDYVGQKGTIHTLVFQGFGADLNLSGEIETRGNFPLHLQSKTDYRNPTYGEQQLSASIDGELKQTLNIHLQGKGISDFSVKGTVAELFETPTFSAELSLTQLDSSKFGLNDTVLTADMNINGTIAQPMQLSADGKLFYDSPATDKIQLTLDGDFDGKRVDLSAFTVNLLTAKQQLSGTGEYDIKHRSMNIRLASDALKWPQNVEAPPVAAQQLQLSLTGTLDNYHVNLQTDAVTEAVGVVPLKLSADGNLQSLKQFALQATLNEQPLHINGKATWQPTLAYQARVQSEAIAPFLSFPGLKDIDITATGDEKAYRVNGRLHVYADYIPPSDIELTVNGSPTELTQADLSVKTLGGSAQIAAKGNLLPLDLTAELSTENIQPQRFFSGVEANITTALTAQLKQNNDNLTAKAVIETLTGQLQNYPLTGSGTVAFDRKKNELNISELNANLAGNRVAADGVLSLDMKNGQSDVTAKLDAQDLQRLLPDLAGALHADIVAKGSLSAPEIQAKLRGSNVAFQAHRVNTLNAAAHVSLTDDRVQISADTTGINAGGTVLDTAKITVEGKISAHQLTADIGTPKAAAIPSVKLVGNGGLSTETLTWSGQLQQLNLVNDLIGAWQLSKHAPLVLSAENVRIGDLCLQQKSAQLCTAGTLNKEQGDFDVTIHQVKTQQFGRFIPDSLKIDTTIAGKAKVQLQNGAPTISGKIAAEGGTIALSTGSGALTSKIQRFDTAIALKNNRLESAVVAELSKLGKINITAGLPNINRSDIRAQINIDNQSLKFLEELAPQLTDVNGRLSGDMTVSGNPTQALNVAGKITLHETDFNVPQFGTEIRDLTLDIFAKNGNTFGFKGKAEAGGGRFDIDGGLNPATQRGNINVKGKNFQVADSRKLKVAVSPDLQILFADTIQIRGEVEVPKALIVPESAGSKITASEDVVMPGKKVQKQAKNSPIDVEISVKLGDDVRVAGADMETRLSGGLKIAAKPGKAPKAAGTIEVQTGELRVYGQLLNIERGRVIFSNGPIANPSLDIRTSRKIEADEVTVGANVLGTVRKPEISLFSTPAMSDSSILSYLLFGRAPGSDSFGTAALLQTGGLVGANTLARDLRSSVGLDVLDFSLTGMEAGKNFSKKLYVGMKSDFFSGISEFLANYKINSRLKVKAAAGADEMSIDLIRVLETD